MGARLPEKGLDPGDLLRELEQLSRSDMDPSSGRMFGHAYVTGDKILEDLARKALEKYMDKTMLDFLVYPSIIKLENEVVSMTASILGGDDDTVGNFTYGGTESIMLAVKAARDYYRDRKGAENMPEIVLPATGHPAFRKAAHYLGLRVRTARIDKISLRVDIDHVQELINGKTALIVGSAPNYPFGVVDDIKALSDIAEEKKIWLHVDACIGGFVLPFLRRLGERVPAFDFSLPGVTSISADLHKYGYAPKGASVVLFRNREYRRYTIFASVEWPGYPLVNTAVLSTRSAGTLAASWAVLRYLGIEGYTRLASMLLRAKKKIMSGIRSLGFSILGEPESSILAFTSREIELPLLVKYMRLKGWYIQLQPGSKHLGYPSSIHLTISPIHDKLSNDFLRDLGDAVLEARKAGKELSEALSIVKSFETLGSNELENMLPQLLETLGITKTSKEGIDTVIIDKLMTILPPSVIEKALIYAVNTIFSNGDQ